MTITNTYTGETAVQTDRKAEERATSHSQDALTITDTYTDETAVRTEQKVDISGTVHWVNRDKQYYYNRPSSVTLTLYANGVATENKLTVNAASGNTWAYSFKNMPETDANGNAIVYTVVQDAVPNYETTYSADTLTITNSYIGGVPTNHTFGHIDVRINGAKLEVQYLVYDANGKVISRTSKKITAYVTKVESVTINGITYNSGFTKSGNYEFRKMRGVSTITEDAVDDYTTIYRGYDVENQYTPKKTSLTVTKSWDDKGNQDGIRPDSITVKLFANGQDTGKTLTLNSDNQWRGDFTDLDEFSAGEKIAYTVAEVSVPGYISVITGTPAEGYVITNTHTPAVTEVAGRKTWKDNNDQDGVRPDSITINLMKNGQLFQSKTVTANNGWAWSFENLPKYENGNEITYSIIEIVVEGYTTEYNNYDVTNSYTPKKTSISVSKSWEDANNQDGIRPNDVIVKLFADGEDTGKTLTLSQGNQWTGSFTELDQYANGEEIRYTVQEAAVDGYEADVAGSQKEGFVLINTHIPEMTKVEGRKIWNDNGNAFNARPDSINIMLMKNGKQYESMVVTADDDWTWSLGNLPKYENGEEIIYSVVETAVDGYTTEYDGYDVINTYNAEKTSITVVKAWVDNNNAENMRPGKVTIKLFADGKDTGKTLILDAGNRWTGSFTDLDKYVDGKLVAYTVQEKAVDGYNTVITGSMEKGFTVTNSHTSVPKTGDTATTLPWLALMMISGLAVVFIGVVAKKQKRSAR